MDSPNVHPRSIWVRCRLVCGKNEYIEGKMRTATVLKMWYPHTDRCFLEEESMMAIELTNDVIKE